jgi:iron complex transport system permease protein
VARTASASEIPLGILTAIVGAPFFAYLLRKTRGGWQ